jgi:hypothetical protein
MMRYRSAITFPGASPRGSSDSEEASRPIGSEEGTRRRTASTEDGVGSPVGIWEKELTGEPQEEQKRTSSRSSAEQVPHFIGIVA